MSANQEETQSSSFNGFMFKPPLSDAIRLRSLTLCQSKSGKSSSIATLPRRRRKSMATLANTALAKRSAGRFLMAPARIVFCSFFQLDLATLCCARPAAAVVLEGSAAPFFGVKYAS